MAATATEMQALRVYLGEVQTIYQAGIAAEHSYRPALKRLLETLAPGVTATNEPKRILCGAPDYSLTRATEPGSTVCPRSVV